MTQFRRVAITGIGVRTPLGHTVAELFDNLLLGVSGVRSQREAWGGIQELQTFVAATVDGFDPKEVPRKFRRTMGRQAIFAAAAAVDAVAQAGLDEALLQSGRTGVVVGSTIGSAEATHEFYTHYLTKQTIHGIRSTSFFQVMSHTCAANVALLFGVTGEVTATNAACASATQAIGIAAGRIQSGRADVMLAGGADEAHVTAAIIFDIVGGASRGYNDAPELTPRPFDRRRDGIVVAEGAGILTLEAWDHAEARGATILGEVLGYGSTCDARNMASPRVEGMTRCVRQALEEAGVAPEDVAYVNAHATGTPLGDAAEAEALYEVFGDRVPVSSSKGHLGHMMGACGAVEAAIGIETLRRGLCHGTRNLEEPDVAPIQLPTAPTAVSGRVVLSSNFAFGGVNTALVLGGGGAR